MVLRNLKTYAGEVVRIKATKQLAVVISDNCSPGQPYSQWTATVKTLEGQEMRYFFTELLTLPMEIDTIVFRTAARAKFPDLHIV
ncbi:MAG: hypothetical protein K0Q55_1440 [Verrucomicrobia bacterium]|nr:hypothetical protein [Verrucomicrobiota bacterium]